jgi:GrpB-like predicted nucleotidyltransferase (UPF0157 family)
LQLVGSMTTLDRGMESRELDEFYRSTFERLAAGVVPRLPVARYVGFRWAASDGREHRFLGVEAARTDREVPGLLQWEIGEISILMGNNGTGEAGSDMSGTPRWIWNTATTFDVPSGDRLTRWCGEFALRENDAVFRMSANMYVIRGNIEAGGDEVELVAHDPKWQADFQQCRNELLSLFPGDVVRRVEHYGSTSIPGIAAKPVIDVLIEVESIEAAMPFFMQRYNTPEWEYWWYDDHATFVRRDRPGGKRTHHLHVAPAGHHVWQGLVFRDFLRAHADTANAYQQLKAQLANDMRKDRERYTNAKSAFVAEVIRRASS